MPRCQIVTHPKRQNVEYCRVCGEWRYISDVGNEFPNIFWMAVAIAIILMLLSGLLSEVEQRKLLDPNLNRIKSWNYQQLPRRRP